MSTKEPHRIKKKPKEKEFVDRNALLTDLFDNKHIRSIYSLFIAIFIGLFINVCLRDYLTHGKLVTGFQLISQVFEKLHVAVLLWLAYLLATCSIYFFFQSWYKGRRIVNFKLWDYFWLLLLISYYVISFKMAANLVTFFQLRWGSALIVVVEQARFLMKIHAFVRYNVPRILDKNLKLAPFRHFFYFLFVPTCLYRDSYPRRSSVNWKLVFSYLVQILTAILFLAFVFDKMVNPPLRDFGLRKYTITEVVLLIFENAFGGILFLLPNFFITLHLCQNFFAEITRFGDRMCYSDWWTCTNLKDWLVKWNIVIHEWLYVHIYRDFYDHVCRSGVLAKLVVIFASAVVHEWILCVGLGFFFPVSLFMFFVVGTLYSNFRLGEGIVANALFLYSIAFGMGIMITLYTIEYYARVNVPEGSYPVRDFYMPRFLTRQCFE